MVALSARHDVASVERELAAMREVGVLDERGYAAALRYVAANEEEVSDMCKYSPVSDVAWSVIEVGRLGLVVENAERRTKWSQSS